MYGEKADIKPLFGEGIMGDFNAMVAHRLEGSLSSKHLVVTHSLSASLCRCAHIRLMGKKDDALFVQNRHGREKLTSS